MTTILNLPLSIPRPSLPLSLSLFREIIEQYIICGTSSTQLTCLDFFRKFLFDIVNGEAIEENHVNSRPSNSSQDPPSSFPSLSVISTKALNSMDEEIEKLPALIIQLFLSDSSRSNPQYSMFVKFYNAACPFHMLKRFFSFSSLEKVLRFMENIFCYLGSISQTEYSSFLFSINMLGFLR
jgi:hypothetical protein